MTPHQKRLLIAATAVLFLMALLLAGLWRVPGKRQFSIAPQPSPQQLGRGGMITYYRMQMADGSTLDYGVVGADEVELGQTVPVLLALPPGAQTAQMVEAGISGYWGREALDRGWVVVSPIAPDGRLFFQGAEQYLPEFLDRVAAIYPPEGGKFHLAGISNGGISAFRIATLEPDRFHDVIVLPGLPHTEDFERLDQLTEIPVMMFVGEFDEGWVEPMQQAADRLQALNGNVSFEIVPGEGHLIQTLSGGERLFAILEANR